MGLRVSVGGGVLLALPPFPETMPVHAYNTQELKVPEIPERLLLWLEQLYVRKKIRNDESRDEIFRREGHQDVVEKLRVEYNRQNS